ncbi:MAG TPA: HNH endonuclease [Candidatus Paceibacterota bacterium]|nr:HNH endonuclease [Candidatus Paceibacterota bacterium]
MSMPRKPRTACLACGKEPERPGYKYCSNKCQREYQYQRYIKEWKEGKVSGLQSIGIVSHGVKRYLREKFGNKCVLCGWAEINTKTGKVPLVADHINGNWRNNTERNLRLLCPNCDSLTHTFSALNKGNGREHRAVSKRALEARMLNKNSKK